jgi:hypothetical protein
VVEDLLTGVRYRWQGEWHTIVLDPAREPGHVLRVRRLTSAAPAGPAGGGARP